MTQSYDQAASFVASIAGDEPIDFRAIHDVRKDIPAIPFRGTLQECWDSICYYNNQGYGIFAVINALDGNGHKLPNVSYIRAHYIDLDNMSARQNAERAAASQPAPAFAVESSPSKYHVYWPVQPYVGNDRFTSLQRKLVQFFDSDRPIIDPTRVMRLPGTWHLKDPSKPHMVHCWSLGGYGQPLTVDTLETAYAHVNVIDGGSGTRKPLGDPSLAAPDLEWLQRAMVLTDPNGLDRGEWVSMMAAVKQAGWSLTDEPTLRAMFDRWCENYHGNDIGENDKQWNSIRETEVGWPSIQRRVPAMVVERAIATAGAGYAPQAPQTPGSPPDTPTGPVIAPPPLDCSSEILTHIEQAEWFKGCVFVSSLASIMTPRVQFMKASEFNATYGGKLFLITSQAKTVNEAWQAATRGTQYKVPVVDHVRFIPTEPYGKVFEDGLERKAVNMYKPARIERKAGDPSPFLRHISFILPDATDQKILLDYLAHNIKYPGFKIPWAPVLQSAEGAGKGIIKHLMQHCISESYMYTPNADELADSGSKFNGWMRAKLFILADEIKVGDRHNMIEILKPMISEVRLEVQSKGVDQRLEDNYANWMFFTNYKDAVPINRNSRRFAIFYSHFQSMDQLREWGLGDEYFKELYNWLTADGAAIMYDWFMNYDIEYGDIPMRAPDTSCLSEVIKHSMSPVERLVTESIEDGLPGFKGGWVSSTMVQRLMVERGLKSMAPATVDKIIEEMGFTNMGRATRIYMEESAKLRPSLFHVDGSGDVEHYGSMQEYFS